MSETWTQHTHAWRVPKDDGSDYGVLVRCGPPDIPYWWLLCPATATLYTGPNFDLTDCSDGAGCDHEDVHRTAEVLRRKLDGQVTPTPPSGSFAKVSHSPDSPFGCTVSWGPSIKVLPDMGWHVCNLPFGHEEVEHVCKCSATFVETQ